MACAADVKRLDPRLDALLGPAARVEQVLEDRTAFFEGPVWVRTDGEEGLLFTDIAGDAILMWKEWGELRTVARSFFETSPAACVRELDLGSRRVRLRGPDGLALDGEGRIVYCGYGPRHVGRLEPDGRRTVLAESYGGRRLNTPNDLVVSGNGTVYFTDSSADSGTPANSDYPGVRSSGVYRITRERLETLDADFTAANGLVFSPDERYLYVNDTRRKLVWRYVVTPSGTLAGRLLFADMNADPSPGVPDGMKVDLHGNLYCTGPGGLWIIAPDGTHLGVVQTRERLTNLAFGGAQRNVLYMTGPSFVWRIPLRVKGASLPTYWAGAVAPASRSCPHDAARRAA